MSEPAAQWGHPALCSVLALPLTPDGPRSSKAGFGPHAAPSPRNGSAANRPAACGRGPTSRTSPVLPSLQRPMPGTPDHRSQFAIPHPVSLPVRVPAATRDARNAASHGVLWAMGQGRAGTTDRRSGQATAAAIPSHHRAIRGDCRAVRQLPRHPAGRDVTAANRSRSQTPRMRSAPCWDGR